MKKNTLLQDFMLQFRVIHALIIREIHTRYGREDLGFLWVLGEPLIFCAGVTILWTAIRPSHEHGLPMTAMVVTGYIPLTMWRHCMGRSVKAFEANGSLLFHRQVTPLDIIIARSFLEIIGTMMAGVLVFSAAVFTGYMELPEEPSLMWLGLLFHMLFSFNTALIFAALTEMSELLEKFLNVFGYLSLPFTGAFIMVDWFPPQYRWAIMWSPSQESIEMIRAGQFGLNSHAHYDIFYTCWINVVLLIIGLYLTLRVRRYIFLN
ncbi:ABC transporter permease [Aristophania vespae]|uniref:ABC transporter permease n=1 Tax=Aristophania vespae TaxID=2697033 RepID=UPI0023513E42|nr:ABC transporter permease [Aristophania vespae]UMM64351.1 Polysialic acid transport protein KpsM [Aristophania vespae]